VRSYSATVPKPYELVIFDCDGVLVDSERLAVRIEVEILATMGLLLSESEVIDRFVGRSDEYMRQELSTLLGRELPADWDAEFSHLYRSTFEAELKPVPGIRAALDRITTPTCVASSGTHHKMQFTLGLTGLYERFEGRIFSATEVARGKPAPDLFLHAARQMDVVPERCAVVEDSAPGVEAALAAGMDVFGYAGGVTPAAKLDRPGVTVFDDMAELPPLLR
jgi:HAD superfamily hydrolase (TIGR01509 family)